jgi:hypothetical protein
MHPRPRSTSHAHPAADPRADYTRVDLAVIERRERLAASLAQRRDDARYGIRWWVVAAAIVLSAAQSVLWVLACNLRLISSSSLVPVIGFTLFVFILAVGNPLMRLARWLAGGWAPRPHGRAELIAVFAALMVASCIPQFGLAEQLVPLIPAPLDPKWNVPQLEWEHHVIPYLNRRLYITDTTLIQEYRRGWGPGPPASAPWGEHAAFYLGVLRRVPWWAWIKPLGFWLIFVVPCLALFYSLPYVVLPLWSQREKLIFPLAKVPESLLPEADSGAIFPPMFARVGFWAGLAVSFLILSWNAMVQMRWIGGVDQVLLGMSMDAFTKAVQDSPLSGLGNSMSLMVLFTATALAFLIPAEMSFSMWFYFLLSRLVLWVGVWMGYGVNALDFPTDLYWVTNPVTAQEIGRAHV